jgi:phosphopantothenoylcysteine decarboxylase/phosphopantothenate--cysteine ligase
MQQLCIKRILLGVTCGIAAFKAAELARVFHKIKAEVRVVMTAAAQEFITSLTLQALSENLVHYLIFVFQPLNGHFYVEG